MKIQFIGAAKTVTGSMHILEVNGKQILMDCGLFQGKRKEAEKINRHFLFDPKNLEAVILSHAHIDHSGNIPTLVKKGFRGKIHATHATVDLCRKMLADSGYIHEKDVEYLNKKRRRKGDPLKEPLYTKEDADKAMKYFQGHDYNASFNLTDEISAVFQDAGHILGSALTKFTVNDNGASKKLGYIVDLGRRNLPILKDPVHYKDLDYMIMESTYGGRTHDNIQYAEEKLQEIIQRVYNRGGRIIIPSFAMERTQEIIYCLNDLWENDKIPKIPVYVDSPLAVNVTDIFKQHKECYDDETKELLANFDDPFGFGKLKYIKSVEESKAINNSNESCIIISASGMCEVGRILHHLKNNIEDSRNLILIVGYMAHNTLGRKLVEKWPLVKIFGREYSVKAEVEVMNVFSAHADSNDLLNYALGLKESLKKIFLVHGEEKQSSILANNLKDEGFSDVIIPSKGNIFEI